MISIVYYITISMSIFLAIVVVGTTIRTLYITRRKSVEEFMRKRLEREQKKKEEKMYAHFYSHFLEEKLKELKSEKHPHEKD